MEKTDRAEKSCRNDCLGWVKLVANRHSGRKPLNRPSHVNLLFYHPASYRYETHAFVLLFPCRQDSQYKLIIDSPPISKDISRVSLS